MSTLANALVTARTARGFSQEQLAEAADTTQAAISRYESELREPEPEALRRIAAALGVTPAFLSSVNRVKGAWAIDAHLRRRATAKAGVWRRLEAQLNMLRHPARYVYEEIDVRTEHVFPAFDPIFTEPDVAARMTRMQWRMPVGPVRDLSLWIESAGCLLVEQDFGTDRVDGLSQWVDDHPVMLINGQMPTDRKRLTMAHELAHLCLHTQDVGDDVEREAELFAAEFLMPAEVIRSQLRRLTLGKLRDLKRVWGVSMQALIERAYELKMLDAQGRTILHRQIGSRGWKKHEPASEELQPEHPHLAERIGQALADRGLSPSEISRFTGFSDVTVDNPFLPQKRGLRVV